MNYNKNNSCYVCHKCLHKFFLKTDLERHLNKKEVCESTYNCLLTIDEIKIKSLNKRYYFNNNINPNFLETYQIIYLINNFNEKINIINELNIHSNNTEIQNNELNNDNQINNQINNQTNDINKHIVMIDNKKHYKCFKCNKIYKKKESLVYHLFNQELCNKNKIINDVINKNTNINNNIIQQNILNDNKIVNNNIQNIQNINNNSSQNNNNSQNNYNFELKDFIENNYSYSHIPQNMILNKDFYLHKNFLNLIMENDENKNIYFDGKYAFVYSDGSLKRIQSDKAGYLILEKLDKAIGLYICSNPKSFNEDYSYVDKYYSITKNKYIYDTIYKPYNVDTKKFDYCETKNIRTRDKCLSEITHICNLHKDKTKDIMKNKEYDKYEIDTNYQVNIPNYESSKMRNKGFIDTNKYY